MKFRVPLNELEVSNLSYLNSLELDFGVLQPTKTTIEKDYSDAVIDFRKFLFRNDIYDYEEPLYGRGNGRQVPVGYLDLDGPQTLPGGALMYRANKRGDRRIRITGLRHFFTENELLVVLWHTGTMIVLNGSRYEFSSLDSLNVLTTNRKLISSFGTYMNQIVTAIDYVGDDAQMRANIRAVERFIGPMLAGGLIVEGFSGALNEWGVPLVGIVDPDELELGDGALHLVWHVHPATLDISLVLATAGRLKFGRSFSQTSRGSGRGQSNIHAINDPVPPTPGGRNPDDNAGWQEAIESERYHLKSLPSDDELQADFIRFLSLYAQALTARRVSGARSVYAGHEDLSRIGYVDFKPKDRQDYLVHIHHAVVRRRGDRHEKLLAKYAAHALAVGLKPSNILVHPRDLVLTRGGNEWLVEAKIVYAGDARSAVRQSISQLLEYAHFLYPAAAQPALMVLLSEPVGDAYVGLFESLNISAVWKTGMGWDGSQRARDSRLF